MSLVSIATGLSACTPTTFVVEGSAVTVAVQQAFTSFNNQTSFGSTATNSEIVGATNSGFVYYDASSRLVRDESFGVIEVVEQNPFTVRYTVNDGVRWSDGEAVDGADLLLAWAANSGHLNSEGFNPSRYVDEATGLFEPFPDDVVFFDGASRSGLQYVSTMPQIGDDNRSVTLIYDQYFVDWELAFDVGLAAHVVGQQVFDPRATESTTAATIAKQLVVDAITDRDPELSALAEVWNSSLLAENTVPLVGSGPYSVESVSPNESVTLVANPLYTGDRKARYETVIVRTITNPLEAATALADGEVDVIAPTPSEEVERALEVIEGVTVMDGVSASFEHLDLQFSKGRNPTFDNPLLREAFIASVPVDEIVELSGGVARDSLLFMPTEVTPPRGAELAKAKRLVAESGVVAPAVCVLFDSSNPRRLAEYEVVKRGAEKAGFSVSDCSSSDWQDFLGVPRAYDAALFAWNETTAAVSSAEARLRSTSTVSNFSNYSNPVVDELLTELAVEDRPEKQRDLLEQIDEQLVADSYGLPLFQYATTVAYRDGIEGVEPGPLSGLLWNLWEWQPVAEVE